MHRFQMQDLPQGNRRSKERSSRNFATKLVKIRSQMNATQAQLATYAGLSQTSVAAAELTAKTPAPPKARTPSPGTTAKLLIACGVTPLSALLSVLAIEHGYTSAMFYGDKKWNATCSIRATADLISIMYDMENPENPLLKQMADAYQKATHHPRTEPYVMLNLIDETSPLRSINFVRQLQETFK